MKALQQYDIPFVGLKEGVHDYAFEVGESFFKSFEYSEVKQGKVHVEVSMEKQTRMLIFHFNLKGEVETHCDRCLSPLDLHIEGTERLIVKFGREWEEESDEILIIPETESSIDISSFIYEYIMLKLPYKKVHPEGLCDPDVMAKLQEHMSTGTDPRWEALKALKKNIE